MDERDVFLDGLTRRKIEYKVVGNNIYVWFDRNNKGYSGMIKDPKDYDWFKVIVQTQRVIKPSLLRDARALLNAFNERSMLVQWKFNDSNRIEIQLIIGSLIEDPVMEEMCDSIVKSTNRFKRTDREIQKWVDGKISIEDVIFFSVLVLDKRI